MTNHHVTTLPCRECERLKLGIRRAQTERPSDVARFEALLARHLQGRLAEQNPELFARMRRESEAGR